MRPQKKKRRPAETALPNVERQDPTIGRCCCKRSGRRLPREDALPAICGSPIQTLADPMETLRLSGPLWCRLCADLPRQLLLNFNGAGAR